MVDCSKKLKTLRNARGLTQMQVGDYVGVSKAMVSAYETAAKVPSIDVFIRLSQLFGVSVDYLIGSNSSKTLDVSGLEDETVALVAALIAKLKQKTL